MVTLPTLREFTVTARLLNRPDYVCSYVAQSLESAASMAMRNLLQSVAQSDILEMIIAPVEPLPKLTQARVREACALNGCTVRVRDGEYRVNVKGAHEAYAYYTNDAADAIGTAKKMGFGLSVAEYIKE